MIYLAVSDDTCDFPIRDIAVLEFIGGTANAALCRSRHMAYSLLFMSLERLFVGEKFEIKKEPSGKPFCVRASGERLNISISHTDGLCAVAISDTLSVGVDVEAEIIGERAIRVEKRFLSGLTLPRAVRDVDFIPAPLCYGSVDLLSTPDSPTTVTDRWVMCEAYLKCDGGGFGSFSRLDSIGRDATYSFWHLKLGNEKYSLALAVSES